MHRRADHPGGHSLIAVARDGNVVGELHAFPDPDGTIRVEMIRNVADTR